MEVIRRVATAVWCAALASSVGAPAAGSGGARDIVFSARYYTPPNSRVTSHFHLYRINPDGSGRTQITFGDADDAQPLWSPDGKRIAFVRRHRSPRDPETTYGVLCVTGAWGGRVTKLRRYRDSEGFDCTWMRNGAGLVDTGGDVVMLPGRKRRSARHEPLSPDGRHYYYTYGYGEVSPPPDDIVDTRTGRAEPTGVNLAQEPRPVWLSSHAIVGLVITEDAPVLCALGIDGKVLFRVPCLPGERTAHSTNPQIPVGWGIRALQKIPGDQRHIVIWDDESNSTVRPFWRFYRADVRTGQAKPLCEGQFLAWSPDGKRFATANRDLVPYGRRWDGSVSRVWGAQLRVVDAATGRAHSITSGTVLVDGADWRNTKLWRAGRSATSPDGSRIP
jgi:dipeptidyl aminopeptidase/acylaminoacyl peptidase